MWLMQLRMQETFYHDHLTHDEVLHAGRPLVLPEVPEVYSECL